MRAPVGAFDSYQKPEVPDGPRGQLFRKYVALFVAVVTVALMASGLFDMWFSYRKQRELLLNTQREQASAAAGKITQFVEEIERQELRALTPKKNWIHLNSIMRRAKRLGIRRGDDDGEMEVFKRWAKIRKYYESIGPS